MNKTKIDIPITERLTEEVVESRYRILLDELSRTAASYVQEGGLSNLEKHKESLESIFFVLTEWRAVKYESVFRCNVPVTQTFEEVIYRYIKPHLKPQNSTD